MTIPWQMNCEHKAGGWCLGCVFRLGEEAQRHRAALEEIRDALGKPPARYHPESARLDGWEAIARRIADAASAALADPAVTLPTVKLTDFEVWMAEQFHHVGNRLRVEALPNPVCLHKDQAIMLGLHVSNEVRAMPPTLVEMLREKGE